MLHGPCSMQHAACNKKAQGIAMNEQSDYLCGAKNGCGVASRWATADKSESSWQRGNTCLLYTSDAADDISV
eukprot:6767222-Alexandrium_andersonii.AAC.1